jgi:hypothetical protein
MALTSSGEISFADLNQELGNDAGTEIDFETAAQTLGVSFQTNGSDPIEFDEFYGLSQGRVAVTIKYIRLNDAGEITIGGWNTDEMIFCAEASITGLSDYNDDNITYTLLSTSDFNEDGTISNGDIIYNLNTGTSVSPAAGIAGGYVVETTQNVMFQINSSGVVSNLINFRAPQLPTKPTTSAVSSTRIDVTIPSTNTVVTRTFKIQRAVDTGGGFGSYSDLATIVPSASGSTTNTSVSTTYQDTSVSAGNSYKYQVRGQNNFTNSNFSTPSDSVTAPAGTSISSSPTSELIILGSNSITIGPPAQSGLLTVSITNRGSNTVAIARTQNTSGAFTVAYSTSGDPGTSGTANGGSGFGTGTGGSPLSSDTIYIRTQFNEAGKNVSEGPTNNTVDVTCNGVTLNINVSCRVTNF